MAEKKEKKIISAKTGETVSQATIAADRKKKKAEAVPQSTTGLRVGAIVLWVAALAFEILALMLLLGKINLHIGSTLTQLIIMLVLDLVCVIIGAQLWKKANHIHPASEENKATFWLWNNMGVIVCTLCFLPFIILALTNKNADKKTKTIAAVVAVIALLIGGVASYDWNPVSVEQQQAAMQALGNSDVFWSPYGHVYHTHDDCQSLNQSDELTYGTVEEAIAANRTRLCAFCAKRDSITNVVTDGNPDEVELLEESVEDVANADLEDPAA
ncbi:MAG: hypothetical protein KBS74_01405 [Clostridiales bacterium]|nr:hypothetical protein [Candidatus Cacconaster stercorequi]